MRSLFVFVIIASLLFLYFTGCQSVKVDNTPIQHIDIKKYLGQWYEIARLDHSFERDMEQTKAEYTLLDDGYIQVVNTGLRKGKFKTSVGKAKITETPALLRVSFFGPFYSDYRILMLDENYQYALVGGSSYQYLWILARNPLISNATKDKILAEARRRGYDVDKLIWVRHDLSDLDLVSETWITTTPYNEKSSL